MVFFLFTWISVLVDVTCTFVIQNIFLFLKMIPTGQMRRHVIFSFTYVCKFYRKNHSFKLIILPQGKLSATHSFMLKDLFIKPAESCQSKDKLHLEPGESRKSDTRLQKKTENISLEKSAANHI